MENGMKVSQKLKIQLSYDPASLLQSIYLKELKLRSWTLHSHVHCSIIHNNWDVEAKKMSTDEWMDGEILVYAYNGILLGLKKERNPVICNTMDEPGSHYALWSKPITEEQVLYHSSYMRYENSQTHRNRE